MKRTKRPYGVDRVDLLQKILTQLCGLNFYINYKSLDRFEPSNVKQQNRPKCPQTLRNKTKHEFRVQWGWIGCIRCDKFGHDFVAWTFELIAPVQPILHWVYCRNKKSQMHTNTKKCNKRWVQGSMRWIGCVCCEKIRHDFVTFALIAPVHPILHRVSCSNEMVPNAPKHYESHQNMSLGSDGVDSGFVAKNSYATLWLELLH